MARQCWRGARTDTAKEKPRRYARGRYWTRELGLGGFHDTFPSQRYKRRLRATQLRAPD